MIKLLIGGSPCTYWSIAQKNGRETEAEGMGWELFKNYLIAKKKFKPDFFLYENNKSAAQVIKDQISRELGVELMYINSALVSAQNRQRFYAFNWGVEQPEDRGIVLKDILEPTFMGETVNAQNGALAEPIKACSCERKNNTEPKLMLAWGKHAYGKTQQGMRAYGIDGKSVTVKTTGTEKVIAPVTKPIRVGALPRPNGELSTSQGMRVYSVDGKAVTQSANGGGDGAKTGLYAVPTSTEMTVQVYEVKNGLITIDDKQYPIELPEGLYVIRKLSPVECERLQTLPDGYTRTVSNAQRYKGLGNGWTAEVIIHILNGALKNVPRDEEIVVLSMYDGIGTGRYCLDKMGFTNVKYYAYEIDKYAMQVAMSNYPDIIQMGDAFELRNPDWSIGY